MLNNSYIIEPCIDFYNSQYSEPHRKYHNRKHIQNMFAYASLNDMKLTEEQEAAIYFHDIYYMIPNKGSLSNEEQSAIYAYDHMRKYFDYDVARATIVKNIIIATEFHHISSNAEDWITPILDLDLWDLYDVKKYKKNALLIRDEYNMYNWEEFIKGRKYWLEKMVQKAIVYQSQYANEQMNVLALKNLSDELDNLSSESKWINFIN